MKSFFTNLKQRYNIRDYKISLVFLVTLISLVGILMVRSARPDLMNRQIMGVCLGLIVMFIISFIDYKWILNLYWPLYALNIVMLLAVLVFGTKVNGARRWLNLGFTQFQPSDLTKILMILFFAKFLMEREQKIKEPKTIIQAIALILPSLALIYKQPNLSTTICIAALFAVLLYLGSRFPSTIRVQILWKVVSEAHLLQSVLRNLPSRNSGLSRECGFRPSGR